ncbi:hypothetical protein PR048_016152 [Dryococelus australis]|uniref:Uncharacterized protein n=1 Tax=Dryococelus australis TaxID=614101 RepID=A0ABQ9HIX9_9NEOP|nr:hypothetical protein PR048_016152 [Dryococelus australis]
MHGGRAHKESIVTWQWQWEHQTVRLDLLHYCTLIATLHRQLQVQNTKSQGAVTEWLACSPPTKVNQAQYLAGSPDFRKWESCRTMSLVGGFSWGSPISLAHSFRCFSILTSITLISSQDLTISFREGDSSGVTVRLLASHHGKPGLIPGRVTQGVVYQLDVALESVDTQRSGLVFIYDMSDSKYSNFDYDLSQKILTLLKCTRDSVLPRQLPTTDCPEASIARTYQDCLWGSHKQKCYARRLSHLPDCEVLYPAGSCLVAPRSALSSRRLQSEDVMVLTSLLEPFCILLCLIKRFCHFQGFLLIQESSCKCTCPSYDVKRVTYSNQQLGVCGPGISVARIAPPLLDLGLAGPALCSGEPSTCWSSAHSWRRSLYLVLLRVARAGLAGISPNAVGRLEHSALLALSVKCSSCGAVSIRVLFQFATSSLPGERTRFSKRADHMTSAPRHFICISQYPMIRVAAYANKYNVYWKHVYKLGYVICDRKEED